MKKVLLCAVLSALAASPAFAASGKANTGCGLGTVIWAGSADNSVISQASQATTNGSFGTQTFGITSGTLECGTPSKLVQNERLNHFVRANMDNLAKDIAQGRGESLDTFAELLQVPADQRPAFNAKLQQNFDKIFTSSTVELAAVIDSSVTFTN
jgi:opacity protein-like surface antigen